MSIHSRFKEQLIQDEKFRYGADEANALERISLQQKVTQLREENRQLKIQLKRIERYGPPPHRVTVI